MPLKNHSVFPVVSQLRYLQLSPSHTPQGEEAMVTDRGEEDQVCGRDR